MPHKLVIPPDQASYAVSDGSDFLRVQLDGGKSRYRKDILHMTKTLNCQWTVGPNEYEYLRSFYNVAVRNPSQSFKIDLYVDKSVLTEHDANFIPGSFGLTGQRGLTFTVSAQLEVQPAEEDFETDLALVELVTEYGSPEAAYEILKLLETLVNEDLA